MMRRLLILSAALAAPFALAACNAEDEVTLAETEGIQVEVNELTYQVQISRQLNPADIEDQAYLEGLPFSAQLGEGEEWFAVFLRVKNNTDEEHEAADDFVIEDTTGEEYFPVELDTPFAYEPRPLGPEGEIPVPDSAAATSTTNGGLILFKVDRASLENRPLEFIIENPEDPSETAIVDLDV